MILSDNTLINLIENKGLCHNLTDDKSIQPASVDITIGDSFSTITDVPNGGIIELDEPLEYTTTKQTSYLLLPKQFVLATTQEYFVLPNDLTAFVEGRSSIGRLGLFIQNAGWVDPGFEGQITLELFNASNWAINIKAGTRVGQLVFARMDKPADNPYNGKYQGQIGATGSKIYEDYKNDRNRNLHTSNFISDALSVTNNPIYT